MKFLPYEEFTIETNKTVDEIMSIMRNNIEPKDYVSTIFGSCKVKDFYGRLGLDRFEIKRVIGYRNGFVPIIVGNVKEHRVEIKMRLNNLAIAFVCVFIVGCLMFGLLALISSCLSDIVTVSNANHPGLMKLIPLAMAVFAYGLMYFAFWGEANRSKELLIGLLGVKDYERNT